MRKQHLDSEAISRWIAGECGPEVESHLDQCAECRREVARLESALAHFHDAARGWSESQPLSRPPAGSAAGSASPRRWSPPLRWAALAAAAAMLAAFPVYRSYSQRQAAQAKADAILLQEVSTDISRPAPEPLEPLIELVSQPTTGDNR